MAWNPSKEVAAARDAARALGDAPICVVLGVSPDGKNLGMASYGKTKALCSWAGKFGDFLYEHAMTDGPSFDMRLLRQPEPPVGG